MDGKINNESLIEFEKNILNSKKTGDVKYSIDRDIEASVKYDFLAERHGKDLVDLALKENGSTLIDLSDTETFNKIKGVVEKN